MNVDPLRVLHMTPDSLTQPEPEPQTLNALRNCWLAYDFGEESPRF